MKKIQFYAFIFLVALTSIAYASEAKTPPPSTPSAEVLLLRAQLESMKFFHDSFISMAIWAFGTAIGIVLALTVFSWFTNKANYERDRDLIKQQTAALKEELTGTLQQKIADTRQDLEKALSSRQVAIQQTLERTLQPKFDGLNTEIKRVTDIALELKSDAQLKEADEALEEKRYSWAIYKYCEALEIFVKLGTDFYQASDVLDKIGRILKIPGISLDADTVNSTVQALQRLPKSHHAVIDELIPRLKKALA